MKTNRPPQPLDPRSENKMHRSSPDAGVVQPISYFHFFFVFFPAKTISNSFLYNHDTFRSVIIMFSFHNNNVPPVFFFSVSRYICRYICVRVNCVIDLDHFFFLYESWNSRQFQPILLALRVLKQKNDDDVEKKR